MTTPSKSPRVAALVGPYASGKTSLLESLLAAAGTLPRKGSVQGGTSLGDASPEARQHLMSVETNIARARYLDEDWTLLDCPGSVEFQQDAYHGLLVADAAVVVVEADPARAVMAAPLLKFLDANAIPHILFINKAESVDAPLKACLEALQAVSERPLLLRELPLHQDGVLTGYVDLVSERAYRYREGQASDLVGLPAAALADEQSARQEMMEHLADFDDHLLEELLSDIAPPSAELYQSLSRDLAADLVVPVFFGSALLDHGVRRLWKCLRHDVPDLADCRQRAGVRAQGPALARVFKTVHTPHTGKMSYARLLRGALQEGDTVNGLRPSGLFAPTAGGLSKCPRAETGEIVALGRLDPVQTGDWLGEAEPGAAPWPAPLPPLFPLAVSTEKKQDEVKLTTALARLAEDDPATSLQQSPDTGELVLWGQGEIHLQVALERLKSRFNLTVSGHRPQVPYKETIRKSISEHGRHKRQSGGHGQFGDIQIVIEPQPRGAGFTFADSISGGVVPRQYIPAVGDGVAETLGRGPLGFPVVDLKVTLTDGSYHPVDSSDQAFKTAAHIAMGEGLPKCDPVLLEPILAVEIAVPADCTSKAQRILSTRRGQILGFEAKDGWKGWDVVHAHLPQAEMSDLIVELRSLTMGVGTFSWRFDHLQELTGKAADKVVDDRKALLAAQ